MRSDWVMAVALIAVGGAGTLSATPAAAQSRRAPQTEIRYAEMDRDHDGVITRSEWQGTRREFDAADWNHDGVLSGEEVRLDPRTAPTPADSATRRAEFIRLDRNNDGILTTSEWKGSRSELTDLDLNHDGVLTQREYVGIDTSSRPPDVRIVDVDARVRWVYAGFVVDKGDVLTLTTDGSVQLSDDPDDTAIASGAPSGRRAPEAPMPQELAGALIARIGNAAPFGVGDQRQIIAPASGQLFLSVNDDHLADNHGRFRVRIAARPPY